MHLDFAIIYFGLTRSTKKVYKSHIERVFNPLKENKLLYNTFMHTWRVEGKQTIWDSSVSQEIDYDEYKLLSPNFYQIDSQELFIKTLDMDNFFYKHVWKTRGDSRQGGEWVPELIRNHLCALESMKRGYAMVEEFIKKGNTVNYVMFIRPDVEIYNNLPLTAILENPDKIAIPNSDHYEGYNDRFAVLNYSNACFYAKRGDEIADYRKHVGRIVSEKYNKFIIDKYKIPVNFIDFRFSIIRP